MKHRHLFTLLFSLFVLTFSLAAKGDKPGTIRGVVEGPGGAVLADAELRLTNNGGGEPLVTNPDGEGEFVFSNVPPGDYTLTAKSQGFQDTEMPVTVGSTALPHLTVKMKLSRVSEQVTVSATAQPLLLAGENANALDFNTHLLMNMPTKDGDPLAVPSLFLDNAMVGTGGIKLIVDGVEVDGVDLPAASIKDIAVNRNPYSAEFGRPGRGRLEITTKKGVHGRYRGTFSGIYRTSDLYARNAFSISKPYEERKLIDGEVDGPVPLLKSATFFVSGRYRSFGDVAVVNAITLSGPLITNLGVPIESTGLFARFDVRLNKIHKATMYYRFKDKTQNNMLVNYYDLPEHATNAFNHANEARILDNANYSATFMNQIRLGYKDETQNITSVSDHPGILVSGAFSSGGAQVMQRVRERFAALDDVVSLSRGNHLLRYGGGVRRRFYHTEDASNFGGTFSFSSLTDFLGNGPYLYTLNTGNPFTSFRWTEDYIFVQDEMHLRHNLALMAGARQEYQSSVPYAQSLAPRLAVAYAPGDGKTVIRAGMGVFYDREPWQMIEQSRLYNGSQIQVKIIQRPGFPDPYSNLTDPSIAGIPSVVRIAPNTRIPYLFNGTVTVERQMSGKGQNFLTLEVGTIRGVDLYRLRNVNAPLPGGTRGFLVSPDPNFVRIDQYESSASSRGYRASLTYRGQYRKFQLMGQYTLARTLDSASSLISRPADNYDPNLDWARADYDRRQQLNVLGLYRLPRNFTVSAILNAWSGLPYNITTSRDDNGDTIANDRPAGLWRNSGKGPGYLNLDLRLSHKERLLKREKAPSLEWAVDAFNALNHVNFQNYIGTMTSPFFDPLLFVGRPNAALPPRQLQLSARFSF